MNKLLIILLVFTFRIFAQSVNCSVDQPPILFGSEDDSIIANGTVNGDLYDGNFSSIQNTGSAIPWPGYFGDVISLTLNRGLYVAAAFNSSNLDYKARIHLSQVGNLEGPVSRGTTLVISECPGDFNVHLNQEKCQIIGGATPNIRWATDPSADTSKYCILQKNKNYYLNIVHSDNSENNNFQTSDCTSFYCGISAMQIKE